MKTLRHNTVQIFKYYWNYLYKNKESKKINADIIKFIDYITSYLNAGCTLQNIFSNAIHSKTVSYPIHSLLVKTLSYSMQGVSFTHSLNLISKEIAQNKDFKNMGLLLNGLQLVTIRGSKSLYLLEKIKQKIEDEISFEHKLNVITAQMRLQANVILLSPLILVLILLLVSPSHITIFFQSSVGILSLLIMTILNLTGWIALKNIINIKA